MSIPVLTTPPDARTSYIIDQLEGERVSIPGSKGTFRILASSKQTNGGIAVFQSGAVLSDAPSFHWHAEAHDVFYVVKGYLKLWNGDKCRIMGPGDFAYIPPKVIHNPQLPGPHTETLGLIAPGDWVDFFRYVGETYNGNIVPEFDDRDLRAILTPKVMAAKDQFDVNFVPDYKPPELNDWLETENTLPSPLEPYFLRANTGPRFLTPRWLTFETIDHCFVVSEGLLKVKLQGNNEWSSVREGQTITIAAGHCFTLAFGSRYVRAISFTNGRGVEELIQTAGSPFSGFVLPEEPLPWEEARLREAASKLGVRVGDSVAE